ncbi:MAG: hypothetical protein CME62_05425 [Halobacteriovoraceae bacterium]|nr:hypothetical protein [Halobacteriovoraceae bacterium]|tara:strand:- start:10869 stop:13658 length:2790 start_codon:yes stop_codon:yes gene_type:complete
MKIWLLFILLGTAFAQESLPVDIAQDSPKIQWKQIENDSLRVIFSSELENDARFVFELINYYKEVASQTYEHHSEKITIVLRPQSAVANGFVALAPRRSEFFMHTNYSPFVGSLEWYQTLAIHEYRHIVQFDFLNRSNIALGYYLGGEAIQATLLGLTLPPWYFEGDAVWVETTQTNGGRGRSPRFAARLKALVMSEQNITYDQLLAGDYTQGLPNHYVFGYFLVTKATLKYGPKIWAQITARAADEPLNPYALYSAFTDITGDNFDGFYQETIRELKKLWGDLAPPRPTEEYKLQKRPHSIAGDLYHFERTTDHLWQLHKNGKAMEEFILDPQSHKLDINEDYLFYTQTRPHHRYGYKSFEELIRFDLKNSEKKQLSHGQRFFHPQISPAGDKILVTQFGDDHSWSLKLLTLEGEELDSIAPPQGHKIVEAVWGREHELYLLLLNLRGEKFISQFDLRQRSFTALTEATRNNIWNLHFNENIYFEADYKGAVNIFELHPLTQVIAQCTSEIIQASDPFVQVDKIYYSNTTATGSAIKSQELSCTPLENNNLLLIDFLGSTPSDDYHQSPAKTLSEEQWNSFIKRDKAIDHYNEYSGALTPHSWSFIGSRGSEISLNTSNILRTLSLYAAVGVNAEEQTPYYQLSLSYNKYYPIFSLNFAHVDRRYTDDDDDDTEEEFEWSEKKVGLSVDLPYVFQRYLYSGFHNLRFSYDLIAVGEQREDREIYDLSDETLKAKGVHFQTQMLKTKIPKEIFAPLGYQLDLSYTDYSLQQNDDLVNYLGVYNLSLFSPGFGEHHGIHFRVSGEYRPQTKYLWQQQTEYLPSEGYTFSRGYGFDFTPHFTKYTLEYALPGLYPNTGYKDWIYFNRIYFKIFYDHTYSHFNDESERTLNSKGMEIYFESLTFRKFPLTYGLRLYNRNEASDTHGELFITL